MGERRYQFKEDLLEIHKKGIRNYRLSPGAEEVELKNHIQLVMPQDADIVIETAIRDFEDYLFKAMDVSAWVTAAPAVSSQKISIEVCRELHSDIDITFEITVTDSEIIVKGENSRSIAQGLYYLESLMNLKCAPFLQKGTISKKAIFKYRYGHAPFGMYEYPDEAFAHMAHSGMTMVAVWLSDPYTTLRGDRIDLNLLCKRAKKYGLDIGVTLDAPHDKAPGDPGAQEYYDKMYGELFCIAPDIALVSIAGETAVYPSTDERVGRMSVANGYNDNIPVKKAHPANWPCRDFPEFVAMIARAVKKHNKNAKLVLSTYNWGYAPEEDRFALIKGLPEGIIIQPTWDMFHQYRLGNSIESISDYSLSFTGPGEYFASEAELAKKLGIALHANAQCSGRTWDFGVIPYEPMPGQWIRRYEALRRAHEQWDLCGVAENIHYGFYPSMISELEKWAFFSPYEPLDKILEQILIRDFGKANASEVKKALDLFDEAILHYVPTNEDQYGAFRIGPAYPFWLEESSQNLPGKGKKPDDGKAMFGNNIYLSRYTGNCTATSAVDRLSLAGVRIYDEIDSNKKMSDLLLDGIHILKACKNPNQNLIKLCGLAEFIYRSAQTVINLKEFFILTQQLNIAGSSEKAAEILDDIENILIKEKENVEATIPIVQADSRLGWEPSMEYTTDEKGLRWKLKQLDYTMDFLLPVYKRATRVEI